MSSTAMMSRIIIALLAVSASARPQAPPAAGPKFPASGENGKMGGIFGMGDLNITDIMNGNKSPGGTGPPSMFGVGDIFGSESPKKDVFDDGTPGTGPYPAGRLTDPTLDDHTIYAPKTPPPANVKLPVLIFGNGGCGNTGSAFTNLLTEIASHGYIAIANGAPFVAPKPKADGSWDFASIFSGLGSMTKMKSSSIKQMTDAIDWVSKGNADKFGNVDKTKIAAGGQSCGGLQAYSTSYHDDRVKLTILFNSGVIEDSKTYLLSELKAPIVYMIGGPKDIAYNNAERDWVTIPTKLPAVKMNLDAGHIGTYYAPNAGKFGNASVAVLDWILKGDQKAKALFFDKDSQLIKDKWNITTRNW